MPTALKDFVIEGGLAVRTKERATLQNDAKHMLLVQPAADDVAGILLKRPSATYAKDFLCALNESSDTYGATSRIWRVDHHGGWGGQAGHVAPGTALAGDTGYAPSQALWIDPAVDCIGLLIDNPTVAEQGDSTQDFLALRDVRVDPVYSVFRVDSDGHLISRVAGEFYPRALADVALRVQGIASQTGSHNLFEVKATGGVMLSSADAGGGWWHQGLLSVGPTKVASGVTIGVKPAGNGTVGIAVAQFSGSQTQDLLRFTASDFVAVLSRVNESGYFMTRKSSPPPDSELATSEIAQFFDDQADVPKAMFKAKDSLGVVRNGWIAIGPLLRNQTVYKVAGSGTTLVQVAWPTAPTVTASATTADDDDVSPWVRYDTSTIINNVAKIVGTSTITRRGWLPDFYSHFKSSGIANLRVWSGLFVSTPEASADPAIHGAGFRFDTGAGDANWQAWSNDGTGGGTITNTGVAYATSTPYRLRIVMSSAAIQFYINEILVATHTTNLPAVSQLLLPHITVQTLAAALKGVRFSQWSLSHA